MAPSVRSAGTRTRKVAPTLLGFAKVSKSTTVKNDVKRTPKRLDALSSLVILAKPEPATPTNKRKRYDEAEESATEECTPVKKIRGSLPTPPSSERSSRCSSEVSTSATACHSDADTQGSTYPPPLPQGLKDLVEIYKCFLKAFSFHVAHNGPTAPAEINELMLSMTRLYKKKSIEKEDIQRMLAIYEANEKTEIPAKASLVCNDSPFKLVISGVGSNRRSFVEYMAPISALTDLPEWKPKWLQVDYKTWIDLAWLCGRRNPLSYVNGPVSDYPLLAFSVGAQTISRQQKASELRKHVLGKHTKRDKSPEFSDLSISEHDDRPQASQAIKARTLSLFERVKAKQAANNAKAAPTSEDVLRRHAIGRMEEVVEIMKMKQHQRLNFELDPSEYTSPETPLRRVSFTMPELVEVVKGSMTNPMGDEELKMSINILAREVPGFWLRRLNMDGVLCVVMQGRGPAGKDVQNMLKAKASRQLDAEIFDTE